MGAHATVVPVRHVGVGVEVFSVPEAEVLLCPLRVPAVSLGDGAALHGDPLCRLVRGKRVMVSQVAVVDGELDARVHCHGSGEEWLRWAEFVRARALASALNGGLGRLQAGSPWALDELLVVAAGSGDARALAWAREVLDEALVSELVTRRMLTASFLRTAIAGERFPPSLRDESVSGELTHAGDAALWGAASVPALWSARREVGRAWCQGDLDRVVRYGEEVLRAARSLQQVQGSGSAYSSLAGRSVDDVVRVLVSGYSGFVSAALSGPEVSLRVSALACPVLAGSALAVSFGAVSGSAVVVGVPEGVASLVDRVWAGTPGGV